jgi:hypothetical protein
MINYSGKNDQRSQQRVNVESPATISIGSQLTVKGQLKDISLSSAFIRIKNSLYLNINDEIGITIQCSANEEDGVAQGLARISRIVPGEGLAVYFTKIDEDSLKRIKKFLLQGDGSPVKPFEPC